MSRSVKKHFRLSDQIAVFVLIGAVGMLVSLLTSRPTHLQPGALIVKPYLQLGSSGKLAVVWQLAGLSKDSWTFEVLRDKRWVAGAPVKVRPLIIDSLEPMQLSTAEVTEFGTSAFDYRILRNGKVVFSAHANARAVSNSHFTFAVMGDCGADTTAQRKVAYQLFKSQPNFVLITGDIVYAEGRASEYLHHFFPVYNNDKLGLEIGAPLMRSTLMIAVPGNHDIAQASIFDVRNMAVLPDSMAYFYEWLQPLNGPGVAGAPNTPRLLHNPQRQARFREAAGKNYPAMSNFYFDLGDARFVALDADHYMDWNNVKWRSWLDDVLKAGRDKTWRIVFYHQTAFNSDASHFSEQRMRLISDILEKNNVPIVFSGHAHNYQRTFPLRFKPEHINSRGVVSGEMQLGKDVDIPQPGEIIYITSGGGGGHLTGLQISKDPSRWQPFTKKFVADTHSFSLCEANGRTLTVKQISEDGVELDRFTVSGVPFTESLPSEPREVTAPVLTPPTVTR